MSAQPVNSETGERGPVFPSATAAALWIIVSKDAYAWGWEMVDVTPEDGSVLANPEPRKESVV